MNVKFSTLVPFYGAKLVVWIVEDQTSLLQSLGCDDLFVEESCASTSIVKGGRRDKYSSFITVVFEHRTLGHGVIAHELFHVRNMIMDVAGCVDDKNHNEPHAYLAQWLTSWLYRQIDRHEIEIEHY